MNVMVPDLLAYEKWYEDHEKEILRDFFTFLKFPSISADSSYHSDVRRCAEWLQHYLNSMGMKTSLWETSGQPVVFASYLTAGSHRPTLLLYHHYDVQPIDPLELWTSDPFTPTVRDHRVYARGCSDNKGQCFYSITALRAFLQLCKKVGINIKLFIEGEEESGGKGTEEVLSRKKTELAADHLLVVDSGLPEPGIPAITIGVRGIVTMEVACHNAKIDLHSGSHGGIALNPNRALVQLLAKLWDESGKVAVPHFYEDVHALSFEEKALIDLSFDTEKYIEQFGVHAFAPEPGYSIAESSRLRPTLEINGMSGGYAGRGFKTVIPASALAKISCRLVSDQDPEKIAQLIFDFLKAHAPKGLELKFSLLHGAKAFRSKIDSPIAKTVAKAYEEVLNQPCKNLIMGGSIPIVPSLAKVTGAETILMGYGLDDDDIHAPNEHFGLDRFKQGFLTIGRILSLLSQ